VEGEKSAAARVKPTRGPPSERSGTWGLFLQTVVREDAVS